jgi:hypothetical protein
MNVGHLMALSGNNTERAWATIHELAVGGIYHLPLRELIVIMNDFADAYRTYLEKDAPKPQVFDAPESDDDAVRGMLDGIEGL